MGYLERTIKHKGNAGFLSSTDSNGSFSYYINGNCIIYDNRKYNYTNYRAYDYPFINKLLSENISEMLNEIPEYENTLEVLTDTIDTNTGFGNYEAYIIFQKKEYKIQFFASEIQVSNDYYSYNNYNYIKLYDLNSNTVKQVNLPYSSRTNPDLFFYFHFKIYYNNENIVLAIYNSQTDSPQYESGIVAYIGKKITTIDTSDIHPCFGSTTISYNVVNEMSSVISKFRNNDESSTYSFKNNLYPKKELYHTKIMKAYTNELCWYLENAYILSNDIKGLIKDADNHKYICFGKFMFQYE